MNFRNQTQRNAVVAKLCTIAGLTRTVTDGAVMSGVSRSAGYGVRTSGIERWELTVERIAIAIHGSGEPATVSVSELFCVPSSFFTAVATVMGLARTADFDGLDAWIAA